jgi:hypothetical protein
MNFIKRHHKSILLFLLFLIIGILWTLVVYKINNPAYGHENNCRHHHDCEYPTPTKGCWREDCWNEPTVTPTLIPSEEVTPTPSVASPSVTETPTPTIALQGGNAPTFPGSTTNPPAPVTCNIPFTAPVIVSFKALGHGIVEFDYLNSEEGISKFSAIYGYSPDQLIYGVDNLPATSRSLTITGLQPGRNVWLQMWNWKNGCAMKSALYDPLVK